MGAALVEMLLAISLLLVLSFGVVEYGQFFFVKHTLQGAAREGVRAAILPGATAQGVADTVAAVLRASKMEASGYKVVVTDAATEKPVDVAKAAAGTMIKVEVQCTWGKVGVRAMPVGGIDAAKVVGAAAVMRKEG